VDPRDQRIAELERKPEELTQLVFCLLADWKARGENLLDLSPARWRQTSQRQDVIAALEAHPFGRVALGLQPITPPGWPPPTTTS
jgi:hypothetical protein